MKKNCILSRSITHPAYLIPWEPMLLLWKSKPNKAWFRCLHRPARKWLRPILLPSFAYFIMCMAAGDDKVLSVRQCLNADHLCKSIQWRDIHTACFRVLRKHTQNCKLGADGFSAASRRTNEHVVITVVDSVEDCNKTSINKIRASYNDISRSVVTYHCYKTLAGSVAAYLRASQTTFP